MSNIHESVYLAPGSVVLRDVTMAKDSSVWFNTVIRGDEAPILIGEGSNIQDNAVVHGAPGFPVEIGKGVTVGHAAVVHGCKIGDHTLIGMGAIVLNGAVIGSNCIIGAGAIVTGGTTIPDGSVVVGSPAKVVSSVSEKHLTLIRHSADEYVKLKEEYRHASDARSPVTPAYYRKQQLIHITHNSTAYYRKQVKMAANNNTREHTLLRGKMKWKQHF